MQSTINDRWFKAQGQRRSARSVEVVLALESHAQNAQLTGGLSDSACRATTSISARPLAPANVAPATQRHSSRYTLSTYADQCCNTRRG